MKWHINLILIFILCFAVSINNYNILKIDNTPFIFEIYESYKISADLYGLFSGFNFNGFINYYINDYYLDYPPILIFQAFPFYLIMGVSEDTAAFSNIIHIFILLFSVYFIGLKLKNQYIGLFSSFIIGINPWVNSFSRAYLPEFSVLSLSSLSFALFIYSNNFKNKIYVFLFGLSFGIGMLTKVTFFIYFLPIIGLIMLKNYKHIRAHNLIYALVPSIIFFVIWYPKKLSLLYQIFLEHTGFIDRLYFTEVAFIERITSIFLGYLRLMGFDIFFFILFFFFVLLSLFDKTCTARNLAVSFAISFFGLAFIFPTIGYFVPHFLCLSILAGFGIGKFCNFFPKKRIVVAIFVFLIIILSINPQPYPREKIVDTFYTGIYSPKNFSIDEEIFSRINNDKRIEKITVFTGSHIFYLTQMKLTNLKIESLKCIFRTDLNEEGENKCMETSKNFGKCDSDAVIFSDPIVMEGRLKDVVTQVPKRGYILNESFNYWENCKKYYTLNYSYYEKTERIEIMLWKKIRPRQH